MNKSNQGDTLNSSTRRQRNQLQINQQRQRRLIRLAQGAYKLLGLSEVRPVQLELFPLDPQLEDEGAPQSAHTLSS